MRIRAAESGTGAAGAASASAGKVDGPKPAPVSARDLHRDLIRTAAFGAALFVAVFAVLPFALWLRRAATAFAMLVVTP